MLLAKQDLREDAWTRYHGTESRVISRLMPSLSNSPWMRGAPQVGFSRTSCGSGRGLRGQAWVFPAGLAESSMPRRDESPCGASQDGLGLNNRQRRAPFAPDVGQPDPHYSAVHRSQLGALSRGTLQHADLVTQSQVLKLRAVRERTVEDRVARSVAK